MPCVRLTARRASANTRHGLRQTDAFISAAQQQYACVTADVPTVERRLDHAASDLP
jgi:hypothetical protein